jgi:polyferredoxin
MDKMDYDPGLIRYTTLNELSGKGLHIFRPRVFVYAGILVTITLLMFASLMTRIPVSVDVTRDRNILYREAANGDLENVFVLKIMNQDNRAHNFVISAEGLDGAVVDPEEPEFYAESGAVIEAPVRIRAAGKLIKERSTKIHLRATATDAPELTDGEDARFIAPSDWFQ